MKQYDNVIIDPSQCSSIYEMVMFSDIGCREEQQNFACISSYNEKLFAAVCDGMGGESNRIYCK